MEKDKKIRYICFLPFLLALILEISVFNFRSLGSMFNKEMVVMPENLDVQGAEGFGDGVYRITDENGKVLESVMGSKSEEELKKLLKKYL